MNLYSLNQYFRFYTQAVTKYQLHSPAIFTLVMNILEDTRMFYAFSDMLEIRRSLLRMTDQPGDPVQRQIRADILANAPKSRVGERLFRLVQHFSPERIFMFGSGASLGCLYVATAGKSTLEIWENQKVLQPLIALNLESIKCAKQNSVFFGESELPEEIRECALVICFSGDGFNDPETLSRCFPGSAKAWVLMNMYASPHRLQRLNRWKQHPHVRASVDFFDFTVLLPDKGIRAIQHLKVVPAWQKPWKFY